MVILEAMAKLSNREEALQALQEALDQLLQSSAKPQSFLVGQLSDNEDEDNNDNEITLYMTIRFDQAINKEKLLRLLGDGSSDLDSGIVPHENSIVVNDVINVDHKEENEHKEYNDNEKYEVKEYNENKEYNEYKEDDENKECNENKEYNEIKAYNETKEYNEYKEDDENEEHRELKEGNAKDIRAIDNNKDSIKDNINYEKGYNGAEINKELDKDHEEEDFIEKKEENKADDEISGATTSDIDSVLLSSSSSPSLPKSELRPRQTSKPNLFVNNNTNITTNKHRLLNRRASSMARLIGSPKRSEKRWNRQASTSDVEGPIGHLVTTLPILLPNRTVPSPQHMRRRLRSVSRIDAFWFISGTDKASSFNSRCPTKRYDISRLEQSSSNYFFFQTLPKQG